MAGVAEARLKENSDNFVLSLKVEMLDQLKKHHKPRLPMNYKEYKCERLAMSSYQKSISEANVLSAGKEIDPLTGVLNRYAAFGLLETIRDNNLANSTIGCLLILRTKQLDFLNNTYGYAIADEFIYTAAKRLRDLQLSDVTIGRATDQKFIIITDRKFTDEDEAYAFGMGISKKVRDVLGQPFRISSSTTNENETEQDSETLIIEGNFELGMAFFGGKLEPLHYIVNRAMTAIENIANITNTVVVMSCSDFQTSRQHKSLILARDVCSKRFISQLNQHYQLQVNQKGEITGAECLVRWNHPKLGLVQPNEFIEIAERSSAILLLGHKMIEMACQTLSRWSISPHTNQLTLSVNVSPKQFYDPLFVHSVTTLLGRYFFDHSLLRFEITESMVIKDLKVVTRIIEELNVLGVTVSIDDFGIGYSSMAYIQQLPICEIKIDRSFVSNITTEKKSRSIVKNIMQIAQDLNLSVITEGVECYAQIYQIKMLGDSSFQGYFINKPMKIIDAEKIIHEHYGRPLSQWLDENNNKQIGMR